MASEIVVPLLHKSKSIGALNLLSRNQNHFTDNDVAVSAPDCRARRDRARQRPSLRAKPPRRRGARDARRDRPGSRVRSRSRSLFARIAQLTKRVIDYRTFGILLLNEANELEIKIALQFGESRDRTARQARRGHRRLRRTPSRARARLRCVAGSALHRSRLRRSLGAGDTDAASRIAASALSISRVPSSMRSASETSRSCRCSRARRRSRSRTPGSTRSCAPTKRGSRRKFVSRSESRSR